MPKKVNGEKVVVFVSLILFFSAFTVLLIFSDSHGSPGNYLSPEDIQSKIIPVQGHISDQGLPEDLLILGAGQTTVLEFEVFNKDPDNDIDTIQIKIPGSEITGWDDDWYKPLFDHEWNHTLISSDTIESQAKDDILGSAGGEYPLYDTGSSIDDALDFIEDFDDMDNPIYDLSEGITLSLTFTAPTTPGIKMGEDAIDLKVGDLKTESPGAPLTSLSPYPFPYVVADNEEKYQIIVLKSPMCDLEVKYGEDSLFQQTRSSDHMISEYGYKYKTDDDQTVAILEYSDEKTITPMIRANEDDLSGNFSIDIFNIEILSISSGTIRKTSIASNYQEPVPSEIDELVNIDQDGDGKLNNLDLDRDGDGILNAEDKFPDIYNLAPVIISLTDDLTIKEHDPFTLEVQATEPEMEGMTYLWTNDKDPDWKAEGRTVDIEELLPDTYIFTVRITDTLGNEKYEVVNVTVLTNQAPSISETSTDEDTITTGSSVTLEVNASDPEGDQLEIIWTHDKDPGWTEHGKTITIPDLEPGVYTFTVTVTDGWTNSTESFEITVLSKDKEKEDSSLLWILIVIAVVILLVALIIVFFVIKKRNKEDEMDIDQMMANPLTGEYVNDQETVEPSFMGFYEETPEEGEKEKVISFGPDIIEHKIEVQGKVVESSVEVPNSIGAETPIEEETPQEIKEVENINKELADLDDLYSEGANDVEPTLNPAPPTFEMPKMPAIPPAPSMPEIHQEVKEENKE